jgi:RNA polymerase sigma-70 factor, ECF subfamily
MLRELDSGRLAVAGHGGGEIPRRVEALLPRSARADRSAGLSRSGNGSADRMADDSREAWQAEFARWYRAGYPQLVAEQLALRGDERQARAAVRAAFLDAWQRWHVVRDLPDPVGWVASCARRLPGVARRRPNEAWGGGLARRAALEPVEAALLDALGQLPEVQRWTLVPHHMAEVSAEQLAEEQGAPLPTVQVRLAHGRLALARWLDGLASPGNAVVDAARWTSGPIEDWATHRLRRLGQALASAAEVEPLASVLGGSTWRRRATVGAAGAVLLSGALGVALATNLSLSPVDLSFLRSGSVGNAVPAAPTVAPAEPSLPAPDPAQPSNAAPLPLPGTGAGAGGVPGVPAPAPAIGPGGSAGSSSSDSDDDHDSSDHDSSDDNSSDHDRSDRHHDRDRGTDDDHGPRWSAGYRPGMPPGDWWSFYPGPPRPPGQGQDQHRGGQDQHPGGSGRAENPDRRDSPGQHDSQPDGHEASSNQDHSQDHGRDQDHGQGSSGQDSGSGSRSDQGRGQRADHAPGQSH